MTKFSKVSIFSDLNQLRDISLSAEYAKICGITETEMRKNFGPEIHLMAEAQGMDEETCLAKLKKMYDGYHFVADSPGLYNPYSLMNALLWKECKSYWFESGTPTMLVEMLKRQHYTLSDFDESIDTTRLDSKDGSDDSIVPLLYQSGYLSILRSDEESQQTWLTFPNEEVRDGFFKFLLPYYTSVQKNRKNPAIDEFVADIREGNVEQFLQRLQSFFADFQYDAQTTPESHFRNVLYILCKLIGLKVDAEYQTSDGRIDLLLRTEKFVYVIECKIDSSARIALQQIKDKEYSLPWALDGREKILIGISFSTTTRRPDDWIIERGDGSVFAQSGHDGGHDSGHDSGHDVDMMKELVLAIGDASKSREELAKAVDISSRGYFQDNYLTPALRYGYIARTLPDKPKSKNQRYYLTDKGLALLADLTKG